MNYIVETYNISKSFKEKKIVDNVNIHMRKGEIYGFVGQNGAGKSTVLKMLLNLTSPDYGNVILFNQEVKRNNIELLKRIGSIIENPYFYIQLTGRENLLLHCEYMGFYDKKEIDNVLQLVSLHEAKNKLVSQYSLGMKQRLAIARAILTKPELLILDEPINALDPEGIHDMRLLLKKLNEEFGISILISSHILSEVEQIADTIGILKRGRLLLENTLEEIQNENLEYMAVEVDDVGKAGYLLEDKLKISNFKIISDSEIRIFEKGMSGSCISELFVLNSIRLESISKKHSTLEDYFFHITREGE